MEIGIDDDFIEDVVDNTSTDINEENPDEPTNQDQLDVKPINQNIDTEDFIDALLKSKGIQDKSKIQFENESGETEEVDWDSLDNSTKLNIINTSTDNSTDLDENELQLINEIRQSKLTPNEYIQHKQQEGVNTYLQNNQEPQTYKVDDLNDEELFVADLMARMDITEAEAYEALDRAKANENIFKKQIGALRSEYKKSEDETNKYNELKQQEAAQAQFNQFAENIENQISDFTEFAGCDLNMDVEDKQELYDFITGFDSAGNSYLGKALNDPSTLVKMAWFALNGEKMIQDINEYYKKEIASVRKESYNKGKEDQKKVVYKPQNTKSNSNSFIDLDDDF